MVSTRASAASSSKPQEPVTLRQGKGREDVEDPLRDIATYIDKLKDAASKLKEEITHLRERNQELEDELVIEKETAESSRHAGRSSPSAVVVKLEANIKALKRENQKKDKEIAKLKAKELKAEAEDLLDSVTDLEDEGDTPAKMRRLLRRFGDLMLASTLGENEKCVVCFDEMELKKCTAFSCGHILCDDCIKQILPKNDHKTFTCPMCRSDTDRDEFEQVYLTETDRWDKLLKIAQAWGAIDHRNAIDTSEEEGEENFIADSSDNGESSSQGPRGDEASDKSDDHASRAASDGQEQEESEMTSTPASSPQPRLSYAASPTKEKRKRLAELAERASKRRR